jgi:hypothetical protein
VSDFLIEQGDDRGWDMVIRDGDVVWTSDEGTDDRTEVMQRVQFELQTWLGESPYDRARGMPYLEGVFGDAPVPGIIALVTSKILGVPGVAELVEDPTFVLDTDTRVLTITAVILTTGGFIANFSTGVAA